MTDQTAPKPTTALTGDEFKVLALTNVSQLQNWLNAIPGCLESGAAGLTADHLDLIDKHLNRCRMFLRSWSLTKVDVQPAAAPVQVQTESQGNGAAPPKRTGGWPRGKPRKPRVTQPESQS